MLEQSLESIWYDSFGFNRYRGYDWMPEPCRSCDEKEKDFGGCRCRAFMLTGSADNADPVCSKSPHHHNPRGPARSGLQRHKVSQLQFRNRTRSQLICKPGTCNDAGDPHRHFAGRPAGHPVHQPQADRAAAPARVAAGSHHEPSRFGLAHLLEHLLFYGGERYG